jgi:hypothetical protein
MTTIDWALLREAGAIVCGLLFAGLVLLIVAGVITVITLIKMQRHKQRMKALREEWQTEHYDADGRPRPPSARGLCDGCARASEKVYFLPSGRRLCEACYATVSTAPGDSTDGAHGID